MGLAVRACCDVVRAGWLARRALVPGGAGHRLTDFQGAGLLETIVTCGYY
ncbi:MAG: hypothetical protein PHS80_10670 [Methanothrix sp.]|nr:hypothetical protein [Methanothrix sp.]MDD4448874.1 hypothetical protein [Methanothrix sp.]